MPSPAEPAGSPSPSAAAAVPGTPAAGCAAPAWPDVVPPADTLLVQEVRAAFADDGALAQADDRYTRRAAQLELALAVAQAIETRTPLVAEAGTGVGKTFAYLVPLLLSGRRALVSTATKSLQDQLFLRDLPRLVDALATPMTLALLKGRGSYLCRHRLGQARQGAQLPDRFAVRALARIEQWAGVTRTGDLAEVDGLDERSPVIPLVTSTRDNCLGAECPSWRDCHVVQARREAMAADVVVVNHHLFFADLALRDTGVAELLPTVDVAVFDEAHQMPEAGVQFAGTALGSAAAQDFVRDLLAAGLQFARGLQPWPDIAAACDRAVRELRLVAAGPRAGQRGSARLRWDAAAADSLAASLAAVAAAASAAASALETVSELAPDFVRLHERAVDLAGRAEVFRQPTAAERVRWIDLTAQHVRLVDSALDIRDLLAAQRAAAPKAWVFTSATLGDDDRLSWFTAQAALEDARTLRVGSPFDYAAHARLWVPRMLPPPAAPGHSAAVAALAARCALALGGRTFVLTTTLRALQAVADALPGLLARAGHEGDAPGAPIEVLVQGSEPKRRLLQRFVDGPPAVLVGSHSFWEGIDVVGDALQCVLIDKLPFPPPADPLVEARVRRLEAEGRSAFNDYFVPEAAVALKQGAGRLIRSETDRGLLVICDPRMAEKGYGQRLRRALPPMGWIAREQDAFDWLQQLAASA